MEEDRKMGSQELPAQTKEEPYMEFLVALSRVAELVKKEVEV